MKNTIIVLVILLAGCGKIFSTSSYKTADDVVKEIITEDLWKGRTKIAGPKSELARMAFLDENFAFTGFMTDLAFKAAKINPAMKAQIPQVMNAAKKVYLISLFSKMVEYTKCDEIFDKQSFSKDLTAASIAANDMDQPYERVLELTNPYIQQCQNSNPEFSRIFEDNFILSQKQ